MPAEHEVQTRHGPARVIVTEPAEPAEPAERAGLLVLGHGAGGGVRAPDLQAAAGAAGGAGWAVALVEQPYRVAGRRSPSPAPRLDEAWLDVVAAGWRERLLGLALVVGGRSSGARVACRTAAASGAAGVLCLAFPLLPPGRGATATSRLHELEGVSAPVLVVQGAGDPFGMPPPGPSRKVVTVPGDHSLRSARSQVGAAVGAWLAELPR